MSFLTPYLTYIKIAVVLIVVGGAYFKGRYDVAVAEEARQLRDAALVRAAADEMQAAAAKAIASIKVHNSTVYHKLEAETRNDPVYTECRNSDVVVGLLNDALRGSAESADSSELPKTDTDGR